MLGDGRALTVTRTDSRLTDHLPLLGFTTGGGATAARIRLMPLSGSAAAVHLAEPKDCSEVGSLAVSAACAAADVSSCTRPEVVVGSATSSLPAALASLPANGR